jgi:hypothetical protein
MPFIEDFISNRNQPTAAAKAGFSIDAEYTLKVVGQKTQVIQKLVGCVFIGSNSEASRYVAQQRSKQALKRAEKELRRGSNPFVTR